MKDPDDQPQHHGTGYDDAHLQRGAQRGARTFSGRAPSAPARRSESPQLTSPCVEADAFRWSSMPMNDDLPEDLEPTFPELGHGPPEPPEPTDEPDWVLEQQRALDEADRVLVEHREGELARDEREREGADPPQRRRRRR